MQNNVIIVGNGPTLLQKENGPLIDSFDEVIRFNQYTILGFEKNVGIRTDYWFNTLNYINKDNEFRMHANYKKIYLHSWQFDPEKDELYKAFVEYYKSVGNPVILEKTHEENTIVEMKAYMGNNRYTYYSTGAIAIWLFLKQVDSLTITGFDWWKEERHHYNDEVIRGELHQPDKEFEFINKLMNEGRVVML